MGPVVATTRKLSWPMYVNILPRQKFFLVHSLRTVRQRKKTGKMTSRRLGPGTVILVWVAVL